MVDSLEPMYPPKLEEYEVTLKRGKNLPYGLNVDTQDTKTLYITSLAEDGPAITYNQQAEPEFQLAMGDFIVEANGASGDTKAILDRFTNDDTVVVKVRRGIDITLMLDRNKVTKEDGTEGDLQPLGMEWPEHPTGEGLVVMAINEGFIADWNDSAADPVSKVQVGDRIIRVGNNTGGALNVAKAIKEVSGKFQLSLVRAAPVLEDEGQAMRCSSHWHIRH